MLELSEHPDILIGELVDEIDPAEVTTVPYWTDTYPIMLDTMAHHTGASVHDVATALDDLGVEMPGAHDSTIVGAFLSGFVTV
jgi:hypothetical protein